MGLPGGLVGEESACSVGDPGSILGLGRSPRGGHGNPLQYSCLENPHGQRNLAGNSPWRCKELDMTEQLSATHIEKQKIEIEKEKKGGNHSLRQLTITIQNVFPVPLLCVSCDHILHSFMISINACCKELTHFLSPNLNARMCHVQNRKQSPV